MKLPLVSIITPLFNSEEYIKETISSVIAQTFTEWEMIIVDDNSLDRSKTIVKNIAKTESRIKLISNDINLGAGVSRNVAIKSAEGKYIAFLDSDDILAQEKIRNSNWFYGKK